VADAGPLGLGPEATALLMPLSTGRAPIADDGRREHDIGLIGTWSWAPNRAGLEWFVAKVAPLLPSDITIAIAGSIGQPPAAPPAVRFVGRVPDAQRFVSASRVMALATSGGTGVQLKTIEALEAGMPAVATRAALRGIEASLPTNVAAADDAKAFADALARSVAAERAGQCPRGDGRAFAAAQARGAVAAAKAALHLAACARA
jgi:glycosyltransferase involved in cell wall biosynthesis